MPVQSLDQIRQRQAKLQEKLATQGESLEPGPRRGLKKKIKRAQRKAKRVEVHQARIAKAQPAPAAEAEAPPPVAEEGAAAE